MLYTYMHAYIHACNYIIHTYAHIKIYMNIPACNALEVFLIQATQNSYRSFICLMYVFVHFTFCIRYDYIVAHLSNEIPFLSHCTQLLFLLLLLLLELCWYCCFKVLLPILIMLLLNTHMRACKQAFVRNVVSMHDLLT